MVMEDDGHDTQGAGSGDELEAEARDRCVALKREETAAAANGNYDRAENISLTIRALRALGRRVVETRKARELAVTAEQYHRAAVCQRRLEALAAAMSVRNRKTVAVLLEAWPELSAQAGPEPRRQAAAARDRRVEKLEAAE